MKHEVFEKNMQTYGLENWGAGYYDVNSKGHLVVRTERNSKQFADVAELVKELVQKRKLKPPLLLAFSPVTDQSDDAAAPGLLAGREGIRIYR